jgi:hypothetical protein
MRSDAVIDAFRAVVHLLLGLVGAVGVIPSGSLAVGAILVTAAIVVALLGATTAPPSVRLALVRARRSIDVSATVPQSDPDAAGHPRSRAPGVAASAA